MHRPVCAAVLAAAEEGVCSAMPGLLASADIALDALARDGHSALEAVLLHRPELLVADVHLPQLDGCSLARRLLTGDGASYRPRILLLCRREFPVPGRVKLEEMGLQVNSSFPCNIEIMAPGTGKGAAVRWLTEHMGYTKEQTMGFGDYTNDLPMLENVGWPVAVANAVDEVKAVCRSIAPACEDDGVAKAICKYVLGEEEA